MKMVSLTVKSAIILITISGCSRLHFSRPGASKEDFAGDCLQAESDIRRRRMAQYRATLRWWTEGINSIQAGSISGNMQQAFAYILASSKLTKVFDEKEVEEFVRNMEELGWTIVLS